MWSYTLSYVLMFCYFFYFQEAQDYGGPRKEFLRLILSEIYTKYFEKGIKEHLSEDYFEVGIVFGKLSFTYYI